MIGFSIFSSSICWLQGIWSPIFFFTCFPGRGGGGKSNFDIIKPRKRLTVGLIGYPPNFALCAVSVPAPGWPPRFSGSPNDKKTFQLWNKSTKQFIEQFFRHWFRPNWKESSVLSKFHIFSAWPWKNHFDPKFFFSHPIWREKNHICRFNKKSSMVLPPQLENQWWSPTL